MKLNNPSPLKEPLRWWLRCAAYHGQWRCQWSRLHTPRGIVHGGTHFGGGKMGEEVFFGLKKRRFFFWGGGGEMEVVETANGLVKLVSWVGEVGLFSVFVCVLSVLFCLVYTSVNEHSNGKSTI